MNGKNFEKKSISGNDEMLLIMITKITNEINDLEDFWKLSDTNNVEIYRIKENKLIEYYNIINKTEIVKNYDISNIKKVNILNNKQNINKYGTIIISVEEKKQNEKRLNLIIGI